MKNSIINTFGDIKLFYDVPAGIALRDAQKEHKVLYMPQVADARINGKLPWDEWVTTPSIKATGRTRQGNAVVVYAHIPNWLANPENMKITRRQYLIKYKTRIPGDDVEQRLIRAIARSTHPTRIPQDELQRLVDANEQIDAQGSRLVWVVDYDDKLRKFDDMVVKKSDLGSIPIIQALEHPETIAFLGGQERAELYLKAHAKAYSTEKIGIYWYLDDLDHDSPSARLLCLNEDPQVALFGDGNLESGTFAGTRRASIV